MAHAMFMGIGVGLVLQAAGCQPTSRGCDAAALEAVATSLEAGPQTLESRTRAIKDIKWACPGLNHGVVKGLFLNYGIDPNPRDQYTWSGDEDYNAIMRAVCVNSEGATVAHAAGRKDEIYGLCEFGRFGLLRADEPYRESDRAAFVLYFSLTRSSVDESLARRLARGLMGHPR